MQGKTQVQADGRTSLSAKLIHWVTKDASVVPCPLNPSVATVKKYQTVNSISVENYCTYPAARSTGHGLKKTNKKRTSLEQWGGHINKCQFAAKCQPHGSVPTYGNMQWRCSRTSSLHCLQQKREPTKRHQLMKRRHERNRLPESVLVTMEPLHENVRRMKCAHFLSLLFLQAQLQDTLNLPLTEVSLGELQQTKCDQSKWDWPQRGSTIYFQDWSWLERLHMLNLFDNSFHCFTVCLGTNWSHCATIAEGSDHDQSQKYMIVPHESFACVCVRVR